MNHQSTEAYRYLTFLRQYLLGDLQAFHEISLRAEALEALSSSQIAVEDSPEITTTQYPYSFEFMFGEPPVCRMTIPGALMLFATIDILGYLTRTEDDFDKTWKNFGHFFSYPFTTLGEGELPVLKDIYRHGMAHNYFPKLNVAISYHSANPDQLFFKSSYGGLVLNVNKLKSIVVNRLDDMIEDEALYPNMESRLAAMIRKYRDDSNDAVNSLLERL